MPVLFSYALDETFSFCQTLGNVFFIGQELLVMRKAGFHQAEFQLFRVREPLLRNHSGTWFSTLARSYSMSHRPVASSSLMVNDRSLTPGSART